MSGGEYLALAYGAVFVVVLAYVAIIAAKLARLQRETREILELARAREALAHRRARRPGDLAERVTRRARHYAARVPSVPGGIGETGAAVPRGPLRSRPLPLQAPTAFVRIRPRGARICGEARRGTPRGCTPVRR